MVKQVLVQVLRRIQAIPAHLATRGLTVDVVVAGAHGSFDKRDGGSVCGQQELDQLRFIGKHQRPLFGLQRMVNQPTPIFMTTSPF